MAFEQKAKVGPTIEKDFEGVPACRCGKPSQVAVATCVNKNTGMLKKGAASEFCGRDNSNNPNWILQDWWELRDFSGFCAGCFNHEKPEGQRKYTADQVRTAWRWLIGETSADATGSLGQTFKRIKLTNDQKDTAIEIVNYEAHRTNNPEAIPDEYKLAEVWA